MTALLRSMRGPASSRRRRLFGAATALAAVALAPLSLAGSATAASPTGGPIVLSFARVATSGTTPEELAPVPVTSGLFSFGKGTSPVMRPVATSGSWQDLGCTGPYDDLFAFVPASDHPAELGSNERPHVDPGDTSFDAFEWYDGGGQMAHSSSLSEEVLFTKAELEQSIADGTDYSVNISQRWTPGEKISLVAFCQGGTDELGMPTPKVDANGYAITAWLQFTVSASPTNPALTSDHFEVEAPSAPTVTLGDHWDGTTGTLTATISDKDDHATTDASGTVTFSTISGATKTQVGEPVAVDAATGTATLPLSGMTPGSEVTYEATYAPDETASGTYTSATSTRYTVFAPAAATTTTLAVTGGTVEGSTQTLKATLAPATAAGTVTFLDGVTSLGQAAVASGSATLSTKLPVGSHSLTARFTPSNDTIDEASASTVSTFTVVAKAVPTVAVSAPPMTFGRAATFTVSAKAGSTPAAGAVSIKLDGRVLATPTLSAGGTTTFTVPAGTVAGRHSLQVTYAGDDTMGAASASRTITIAAARTSTSVVFTPAKVKKAAAKKGTVKVRITVAAPGLSIHPGGKVSVKVGAKKVTATLAGNGTVTVKLPKTKTARISVSATYLGSGNYAASSGKATAKVTR